MQFVKSFTNGTQSSAVTAPEYFYLRLSSTTILIYLPCPSLSIYLSFLLSISVSFSLSLSMLVSLELPLLPSFLIKCHWSQPQMRTSAQLTRERERVCERQGERGRVKGDSDCSVCVLVWPQKARVRAMLLWRCSPPRWLACCAALAPASTPAVWWMTATSVWHHSSASVFAPASSSNFSCLLFSFPSCVCGKNWKIHYN